MLKLIAGITKDQKHEYEKFSVFIKTEINNQLHYLFIDLSVNCLYTFLSFAAGNHMLLRVLPSVYPRQPDTIHHHLGNLTAMMSRLESPEQQHLIRLVQMVAEQHPLVSICTVLHQKQSTIICR